MNKKQISFLFFYGIMKIGDEMKIFIGTDHRGLDVQNEIKSYLGEMGIDVEISKISHTENDDYPDFAFDVCKSVLTNPDSYGFLICGTGIGMSIAANKVKGIRAARCTNIDDAFFAKNHNDCNVMCISNMIDIKIIYKMIDTFLNTKRPTEQRHINRVNKIINYENGAYNGL